MSILISSNVVAKNVTFGNYTFRADTNNTGQLSKFDWCSGLQNHVCFLLRQNVE